MSILTSPKTKAIAAFLAVFLLGGGTGYLAGYWHGVASPWYGYGSWWGSGRGRAAGPSTSAEERQSARAEYFLKKIEKDLQLSPGQSTKAGEILRRRYEELLEIRREMSPRIEGILQDIRQELRALMDPRQKEHFDQMVRTMEEHRRRWWQRRLGGRPDTGPGMGQGMGPMMRGSPAPPSAPPSR